MTEIKPCPFCGNDLIKDFDIVTMVRQSLHIKMKAKGCNVHCWKCGTEGPVRGTTEKAIEAWNNRTVNKVKSAS